MTRWIIILLSAIAFIGLASFHWANAQEDMITIDHKDVFKQLQRPPVKFPHAEHAAKYSDCVQCHHTYEYHDGKRVNEWSGEGQPCSECHKLKREGNKLPLMEAYHKKCTGCHRELVKKGEKSGPVTCGGCHIRAK